MLLGFGSAEKTYSGNVEIFIPEKRFKKKFDPTYHL